MSVDPERAFTLLEIVSRATTNENEALVAARQLGRMKEKAGSFQSLFGGRALPRPAAHVSFNESRRAARELEQTKEEAVARVAELERQVSQLTVRIATLKEANASLKAAMRDSIKAKSDGTMTFKDFAHKASTILGVKAWRGAFSLQTNISTAALNRASAAGVVPPDFVEALARLNSAARPAFSPEEVAQIREWATTQNDDALAESVTKMTGRIVTASAIRKLRTDLRSGNRGYGLPAYGGALPVPKREGTKVRTIDGRNPSFPWSQFPELELLVCENHLKTNRKSATEMARIVSEMSGIRVNEGSIKQRCDSAPPPAAMLRDVTGTGPLTWPELWKLGSDISKRSWKQAAFTELSVESRSGGQSLSDIPQNRVERLRRRAKTMAG